MIFKSFLINYGGKLMDEYPVTYKHLCKEIVSRYVKQKPASDLKDFFGQPFPVPPVAIVDGLSPRLHVLSSGLDFDYSEFQRFLEVAPREAIEHCVRGPDETMGNDMWDKIVEKFPGTEPTFPPSPETLKNALNNFRTKGGLEKEWSIENEPSFEKKTPGNYTDH